MNALIIEDDSVTQRILARVLTARGFNVVAAGTAELGQQFYLEEAFPLIFLDLNLPGMSGLDFCRWLREQPSSDRTYLLVGTAAALNEAGSQSLAELLAAGADDYISKPYTQDRLHVRLTVAEKRIALNMLRINLAADLKRERDFITAVFETAAALILVTDFEQRILRMNPACVALVGMELSRPLRFLPAIIAPAVQSRVAEELAKLQLFGRSVTFEASTPPGDHPNRFISWTAALASPLESEAPNIILSGIDITERFWAEEKLEFLAIRDPLTELYNRNQLPIAMEKARAEVRSGSRAVVLSLDLDEFKAVNDTAGHEAGDRLLLAIVGLLGEATRPEDVLVRLGGDEFLAILNGVDLEQAQAIAEKIRFLIANLAFVDSGQVFNVSASIGLVELDPEVPMDELISRADLACYQAKSQGRNRIVTYRETDEDIRSVRSTRQWCDRIREALRDGSFEIWFQPVVEVATRRLAYYEALLRLRQPDGAIVPPGEFLPAAERQGLMPQVDRHVMRRCARLLQDDPELRLSINLSGVSLDSEIASFIEETFGAIADGKQRITFEITETAVITNLARTREMLGRLRQSGFRFALDDFGAGFASFGYLRNLPIDCLKIDGNFFIDFTRQNVNQTFVRAINDIAHQLGLHSVAEYVADEETFQLVAAMKIDLAQGHLFGKPERRA